MDERLHNILDGDVPEKGSEELFAAPENQRQLREHRKLQEALRQNADADTLSSTEKAAMGAAVAASLGLGASGTGSAATAPQSGGESVDTAGGTVSPGMNWLSVKGAGIFLIAMAMGAGIFAIADRGPNHVTKTIGVPIESTVPSTVPLGLPGAATADCGSLVQELRDSIQVLQQQTTKKRRKRGKKPFDFGNPTPGGDPAEYRRR